jgi:hypothetical protein
MNGEGDFYKGQLIKVVVNEANGSLDIVQQSSAGSKLADEAMTEDSSTHLMVRDGVGIMRYSNGSTYEGLWVKGQR